MNAAENVRLKRRACVRCATAKARCSMDSGDRGCERCRRLKRECIPDEVPRRKKEKQSHRVKALEEKVDTLLSLLGPEKTGLRRPAGATELDSSITPALSDETCSPTYRSTMPPSLVEANNRGFDPVSHGLLDMVTADTLLDRYKRVRTKYFPFVVIPPDIDTAKLRANTPFLFLCIMSSCLEGDHLLQRQLGREARKQLCERVMVNHDRSLELLQGLLVLLGWHHYQFRPEKKQLYMLVQMTHGLIMDLDLDRCPAHRDQRVASQLYCNSGSVNAIGSNKATIQCRRTSAEMRALLGCYYMCSSIGVMRREVAMKHTKWIDNCCQHLRVDQEAATDLYAVALVNTRALIQKTGQVFSYDDPMSIQSQSDALVQMSLNALRKEAAQLEVDPINAPAQGSYVLMAELKGLSVTINESALYRHRETNSNSTHASHLWDLLTSARDLLTFFLNVPSEVVTDLPASFFNLLPYALVILSAISCLPSTSDWDSSIAPVEADVLNFCRRVKTKFGDELTKTRPDDTIEMKDVWQFFSRGIGGIMAWHEKHEASGAAEGDFDISFGSPCATARFGVADTIHALSCMVARRPATRNLNSIAQETPISGMTDIRGTNTADIQPDTTLSTWDDEAWQSIMDDFSMFPTMAGLPIHSVTQY